jgi:hypothetical protein
MGSSSDTPEGCVPRPGRRPRQRSPRRGGPDTEGQSLHPALQDRALRRALKHVPSFTQTLARQLEFIPSSLRVPSVLSIFAEVELSSARWAALGRSLDALTPQRRRSYDRAARRIRSLGEFWDFYMGCRSAVHADRFAPGPDLGPHLEYIGDAATMRMEALLMSNCLAARIPDAVESRACFYRWRGTERANVELRRTDLGWRLGEIGGFSNLPLSAETVESIRRTVGETLEGALDSVPIPTGIESLADLGTMSFSAEERAVVADRLWSIYGRSLSPTRGAYCIFEYAGLYVQFLAAERSYRCEICSHRFVPEMEPRLTDAAVESLEACGFRWPGAKENFGRRLPVQGREDCVRLADFALGALHALCGLSPGAAFETKVVIPRAQLGRTPDGGKP